MAEDSIRLTGDNGCVEVTARDDEDVTVEFGDGDGGIRLVGSRYDVHRAIIEADKQLGRLSYRFA